MVSWEMPDGTEVLYEGASVEPAALREFAVRFMGSQASSWDAMHWNEDALGAAFEQRFSEPVQVHRRQREDGAWQFVIRPRLAFA